MSLPWGLLHLAVDVDTEYKEERAVCPGPAHGDMSTAHSWQVEGGLSPTPRRQAPQLPCPVTLSHSSWPSGLEMHVVLTWQGQF